MQLTEYQNAIKRTLPNLGTDQLNISHMILGMNSEINELIEAQDLNNVSEEISDINWYITNYCNLTEIDISKHFNFEKEELFISDPFIKLICEISKLTNLEKRELAYKKKVDSDIRLEQVIKIYKAMNDCFNEYKIDPFDAMQKNIDKLKARYPEKFTEEKALNRNLEMERNILEGKYIIRN